MPLYQRREDTDAGQCSEEPEKNCFSGRGVPKLVETLFGRTVVTLLTSCLGLITAMTSLNRGQPNFARCLAVSWAGTLYIHFRGFLTPNGFCQVQRFSRFDQQHSTEGHHVGHRPVLLWSPYVIGQTIIFLPCDFYLLLLLPSFFLSSPNFGGRRLDVYHTSTHGVALVRI